MHVPVLLQPAIEKLNLKEGDVFLDATLGRGGHSAEVVRRFGDKVTIIGLDRDKEAIQKSEERLRALGAKGNFKIGSFRNLDQALKEEGIQSVSAILYDIGISSDQFEHSGRGFTFQNDEPLLMTMVAHPEEGDLTAERIVNNFPEETLELILRGFGEEKYSRQIAREIVRTREENPIKTTFDLVEAITRVRPRRAKDKIHPATKTFQALRIAVNEELAALEEGLLKGFEALETGGRMAVITFHSLEDRIVKNFFRELKEEGRAELITKKPIVPDEDEVGENPRSRSAKLRVIEKS